MRGIRERGSPLGRRFPWLPLRECDAGKTMARDPVLVAVVAVVEPAVGNEAVHCYRCCLYYCCGTAREIVAAVPETVVVTVGPRRQRMVEGIVESVAGNSLVYKTEEDCRDGVNEVVVAAVEEKSGETEVLQTGPNDVVIVVVVGVVVVVNGDDDGYVVVVAARVQKVEVGTCQGQTVEKAKQAPDDVVAVGAV